MVTKALILYVIITYVLHVGFGMPIPTSVITATIITIFAAFMDTMQKIQDE